MYRLFSVIGNVPGVVFIALALGWLAPLPMARATPDPATVGGVENTADGEEAIGNSVAQSVALQSHQYRVTYEKPAKPNERAAIGANLKRDGNVRLSLRGNY